MDNWERRRLLGMLALAAVAPTRVAAAEAGEVFIRGTARSRPMTWPR
jgi:hypothetical protein